MVNEANYTAEGKGIRRRVLLIAFGLLVVIMCFTGFVNYMTFTSNYNQALVKTYSVPGNELVRKIEYALGYGKPIDNYYGMQDTLQQLKTFIPELEQVNIVSPQGEILYDLSGFVRDSRLPGGLLQAAVFEQGVVADNLSYRFYQQKAYLFIGINDKTSQVASLVMVFPQSIFLKSSSHLTGQLAAYLAGIAIIALLVLFLIFRAEIFNKDNFNNKRVLIPLILVIGSAQLCYTGVNYFLFKNAYYDMAYTSRDFIQKTIEDNIAGVYSKGLNLEDITGLDEYFDSIKAGLAQIDHISILPSSSSSPQIQVTVADGYVNQQIFKVLLDMLTVLIISVFFMIELTLLAMVIMTRGPTREGVTRSGHGMARALIFSVNFCACMSLTFVPIVMKNLYQPASGAASDVVLALPLSAEMLGGILSIFLAGWLIDKQGWRKILYMGALLLAAGNLLAGLSGNEIIFVIARGIAGLGLGHILMAVRSLVVSLPEPSTAIAEYSAGSIAGLNCGLVIGGLLADRIGYAAVFFLAAVLAVIPFIFVRRFMTGFEIQERGTGQASAWAKFTNFIADKKTVLFLLCIFIPYFIGGAFLDYYFPLFASSNGLSQSDISRGFLLNGLFIIYLGPVLTGYATKKLGSIKGILLAVAVMICALTVFILFGTVPAALVTLVLLGVADSFGSSLQTTHFLNLRGVRDMEVNKGIAYFGSMVYVSRMAGPVIYGLVLSLGMRTGIGLIALGILVLLLVFILSGRSEPAQSNRSEAA